jgi:hypothetical protein|tara:strand:- start:160 stop:360 length:201 start_codon:yes stop_codon:yes gene_type:complete
MRKLVYKITEDTDTSQHIYFLEFITDRTSEWTESQYLRHRNNTIMELVSDEETEEKEPVSREVKLG